MTGLITQTSCWGSTLTAGSNCTHEDKPLLELGQLVYDQLALNHYNDSDQDFYVIPTSLFY